MYRLKSQGRLVWVESEAFSAQDNLVHAFSTRHGGKSDFPYQSLNLGLYTQDDPKHVIENRHLFVKNFGIQADEVVSLHFIHSNKVVEVHKTDRGKGFLSKDTAVADADGMVTNEERVALFVTFADCVPILFYDPIHRAIGACHAGWRGTVEGVAMETLRAMKEKFSTNAEDVLVTVGPAIDPAHFQVGEDVAEAVRVHSQRPEKLLKPQADGKYLFNIWQANVDQLKSCGVLGDHITVIDLSTFSRDDLFFSHRRRLGGEVGRMGAVIMLASKEAEACFQKD